MCAAVCEVEIKRKQILDPVVPQDAWLLLQVFTFALWALKHVKAKVN